MNKFIFCFALLIPFAGKAQDTFTINGKIGIIGMPAKVYLAYKSGNVQILDSAYVNRGEFTLKGNASTITAAKLVFDHTGTTFHDLRRSGDKEGIEKKLDVLNFYLDNSTMTITGTDSVASAHITGSPVNEDNARLNSRLAIVNTRIKRLADYAATITQDRSPQFSEALQARLKPLQTERENILQSFIEGNPKSYISLVALNQLQGPSAESTMMEPLYNSLSDELKQSEQGKNIATYIAELKATAVGTMAPDFTQNDAAGKPISLSSFRGRYVLLDFWASWCKPYRAESQSLVSIFNKYRAKKFTILGVSLDDRDQKNDWTSAVENDGLTWPQVSDLKGRQNAAAALYFVHAIPQNYLISPDGKIIGKNLRGTDLDNKLAEIFGKP